MVVSAFPANSGSLQLLMVHIYAVLRSRCLFPPCILSATAQGENYMEEVNMEAETSTATWGLDGTSSLATSDAGKDIWVNEGPSGCASTGVDGYMAPLLEPPPGLPGLAQPIDSMDAMDFEFMAPPPGLEAEIISF